MTPRARRSAGPPRPDSLLRAEASVRRRLSADLEREGLSASGFSVLVVLTTAGGELPLRAPAPPAADVEGQRHRGRHDARGPRLSCAAAAPEDRRGDRHAHRPRPELVDRLFPEHTARVARLRGARRRREALARRGLPQARGLAARPSPYRPEPARRSAVGRPWRRRPGAPAAARHGEARRRRRVRRRSPERSAGGRGEPSGHQCTQSGPSGTGPRPRPGDPGRAGVRGQGRLAHALIGGGEG